MKFADPSKLTAMVLVFDPLRRFAVAGDGKDGLNLISLADKSMRPLPDEPPGGTFGSLPAVSPDGKLVAADRYGEKESGIRLWDVEANSVRVLEKSKGMEIRTMAFAEDGSLFTGDFEGNILRWNLQDGTSVVFDKCRFPAVSNLAVIEKGRYLLAYAGSGIARDQSYKSALILYDLKSRTSRSITTHGDKVDAFMLNPTKTLLVTASTDGTVRVGPSTGKEPHIFFAEKKSKFQWPDVSPDGRWVVNLANGREDYYLWRVPQGPPLQTLPHKEFLAYLRAQTNLRVVPDKTSQTGYRVDTAPFPGWERVPPAR